MTKHAPAEPPRTNRPPVAAGRSHNPQAFGSARARVLLRLHDRRQPLHLLVRQRDRLLARRSVAPDRARALNAKTLLALPRANDLELVPTEVALNPPPPTDHRAITRSISLVPSSEMRQQVGNRNSAFRPLPPVFVWEVMHQKILEVAHG